MHGKSLRDGFGRLQAARGTHHRSLPQSLHERERPADVGRNNAAVMSQSRHQKLKLLTLSKPALLSVIKGNYMPALTVLVVLYETWFLDLEHKNPVKLTSESLRLYRVSRGQKDRALKVLEKYGAITVARTLRKNPMVTLNWPLPFMEHGRPSRLRHAR